MRIEGKGRIDRMRPIDFTFDGVKYPGFVGDTLASALMANGVALMGRSFKYHRPRGVLTAGSEEPNALVTVGDGAFAEPNIRAPMQELYDGLVARSQNAWPSLERDVLAVNDLLAPFLSAGFYYKTFMWPKSFWEGLYEPFIRRAAGLGALSGESNPSRYARAFAHCDVLVIGAGPAGLRAARVAAEAGLDVILADESWDMGGRLLSETLSIDGRPGADWAVEEAQALAAMGVRLMPRTTVTGAYDGGIFGALERRGHHEPATADAPRECFWRIKTRRAILCAGALERPIAFPNNDRPGIMLAGAARSYLNRFGVGPGARVAVFGNNDSAHQTARDLLAAGVNVTALIDSRVEVEPQVDAPVFTGARVVDTKGRHRLEQITLEHKGARRPLLADCLAISGGWNPTVHLTCHMNGRPVWEPGIASFVPAEGAVPGLKVAGAAAGIMDTAGCLASGASVAAAVAQELGKTAPDLPTPGAEDAPYCIEPLWHVPGKGRAWLDFQNDVTVKDVKQAAQENYQSVEHMKRYTTQGMATDQGKSSNVAALAILADATGRGISETGTTTFRPPYTPVTLAALAAGAQGKGFAPERFTTSHAASAQRGAPMIEAGLWYRPSYFPISGETHWRESCDREVGWVRQSVGVCDVSTLGKIDIQGPDAAAFLDFVYANTFSTLKPGKVRYGLMLREDGHVMDDGTTARLGEDHYVMTTTTAAAGNVMAHLDFVHQCLLPHLNVSFISVTEHWAQFAVAGPRSRELLNSVLDNPIDNDAFPYMGCGAVSVAGVGGRLFRISFSGEHAYEVAVPSRYGDSLFRLLVSQAEALGGGAYGMEALNVMRIEKGFITHAEIHGRTTAFDIGMARMVSAKKDCMGKTMAARPGLVAEDRELLVGIKPVNAAIALTAGAHLYKEGTAPVADNDQGYSTSVAYSPSLGHHIGLAFVKGGRERMGEVMRFWDGLREVDTTVEICSPVFLDPEGERLRG
ncbi:MAG: sarcosine oxidase subunit alpha family protein [Pseudomonadota bacterium]